MSICENDWLGVFSGQGALIQRSAGVTININNNELYSVSASGGTVSCGPETLRIMELFLRPRRAPEALRSLVPEMAGGLQWVSMVNCVVRLLEVGALVRAGSDGLATVSQTRVGEIAMHLSLLNDRPRTDAYIRAIAGVVKAGDVVIDIGTGTGILAMAAARAGARKVYALEASGISGVAREDIRRNGYADTVEVVEGWSHNLLLEEPADVVVSEIIGNDPLDEGVLSFVPDVLRRLARKGASLVPCRLRVYFVPVVADAHTISGMFGSTVQAEDWFNWYGFNFSAFSAHVRSRAGRCTLPWKRVRGWKWLSDPVLGLETDLREFMGEINTTIDFVATSAGRVDGILNFFELELAPGVCITSDPRASGADLSWKYTVDLAGNGTEVVVGDHLSIGVRYSVLDGALRISLL